MFKYKQEKCILWGIHMKNVYKVGMYFIQSKYGCHTQMNPFNCLRRDGQISHNKLTIPKSSFIVVTIFYKFHIENLKYLISSSSPSTLHRNLELFHLFREGFLFRRYISSIQGTLSQTFSLSNT